MPLTFSFSDSQAGFVSIFVFFGGFWVVCVLSIIKQMMMVLKWVFFLWIRCGQVSSIKDEDSRWLLILEVSWSSEAEGLRKSEPLGLLASVWRLIPFDACQTTHTRISQIPFFSH